MQINCNKPDNIKMRKSVPLKIKCPVCGRPAPDHLHFGGLNQMWKYRILIPNIIQAKAVTLVEVSSAEYQTCLAILFNANQAVMTALIHSLERNVSGADTKSVWRFVWVLLILFGRGDFYQNKISIIFLAKEQSTSLNLTKQFNKQFN